MIPADHLQDHCSMGGICSRKRGQQVDEDGVRRGASGRFSRNTSLKWLGASFSRPPVVDCVSGSGSCPSLMKLCIDKICEVLASFAMFVFRDFALKERKIFILALHKILLFFYIRTLINTLNFQCCQGI